MALRAVQSICVIVLSLLPGLMSTKSCTVDDYLCDRNNLLYLSYGRTERTFCEVQLSRSVTEIKPKIEYPGGEQGGRYLLVMVDPDMPDSLGCYIHDLEVMTLRNDVLEPHQVIVGYRPPSPAHGVHRYQFLLYKWGDRDVVYNKHVKFHLDQFKSDNQLTEGEEAVFQILVAHKVE